MVWQEHKPPGVKVVFPKGQIRVNPRFDAKRLCRRIRTGLSGPPRTLRRSGDEGAVDEAADKRGDPLLARGGRAGASHGNQNRPPLARRQRCKGPLCRRWERPAKVVRNVDLVSVRDRKARLDDVSWARADLSQQALRQEQVVTPVAGRLVGWNAPSISTSLMTACTRNRVRPSLIVKG